MAPRGSRIHWRASLASVVLSPFTNKWSGFMLSRGASSYRDVPGEPFNEPHTRASCQSRIFLRREIAAITRRVRIFHQQQMNGFVDYDGWRRYDPAGV